MILIWVGTIQVCFVAFLIAASNFNDNKVIYCLNWILHLAVFVCLGLLKCNKINSQNLLRAMVVFLHARILLTIVQRNNVLEIKDPQILL